MNEPPQVEKVPNTLFGIWLATWLSATVFTDNWIFGFIAACLFTLLVLAFWQGWIQAVLQWAWPTIRRTFFAMLPSKLRESAEKAPRYTVNLGIEPETGKTIRVNLLKTGHILFAGTTGFGKTVFSQSIIHQLIGTHTEHDLKLVILDGKGVSFLVWNNIPHMLYPVASTQATITDALRAVSDEMARRNELIKQQGQLGRLCQNIAEYAEITGERLPLLLVYIDEKAAAIAPKSEADDILVTLGALGRSAGIVLMVGNQTLYVKNIRGDLSANFATKIAFYMPDARAKGVVSQIPAEFHAQMRPLPGLAYVYSPEIQHRMFRSEKVANKVLEERARDLTSPRANRWQTVDETSVETQETVLKAAKEWSAYDKATKLLRLQAYVSRLGRKPKTSELIAQFGMSKPTAIAWRRRIPAEWLKGG